MMAFITCTVHGDPWAGPSSALSRGGFHGGVGRTDVLEPLRMNGGGRPPPREAP